MQEFTRNCYLSRQINTSGNSSPPPECLFKGASRDTGWTNVIGDWCILQSLLPSLWYSNDSNRSVMSLPGTIFPLSVCNVPQWSRSDDVSVHRVSTTAQSLQRGSEWVCVGFVCAVGPAAFAQRRGSAEQNHKTEVLFFIGLAFRDSPSGLVLFKSTMNL